MVERLQREPAQVALSSGIVIQTPRARQLDVATDGLLPLRKLAANTVRIEAITGHEVSNH